MGPGSGIPKRNITFREFKLTEHIYEGLFILDTEKYNRDPEGVSNQIAETIESMGGEVKVTRLWEERRLAYPIKGQKRGTYWLTYFHVATDKVKDLNRQFQINGNILRFLLIAIDPRLEDVLVEHAKNGPIHREENAEDAATADDVNFDDADEGDDDEE